MLCLLFWAVCLYFMDVTKPDMFFRSSAVVAVGFSGSCFALGFAFGFAMLLTAAFLGTGEAFLPMMLAEAGRDNLRAERGSLMMPMDIHIHHGCSCLTLHMHASIPRG